MFLKNPPPVVAKLPTFLTDQREVILPFLFYLSVFFLFFAEAFEINM